MSVFDIIKRRRSIGKMTAERPTRKQIERLLEAATHAPNHHKVEPWRFFVLAGEARKELGGGMGGAVVERLRGSPQGEGEAMLAKGRTKMLRSPLVVVAAAKH